MGLLKPQGFPGGSDGKESPAMQETWVRSLGGEDPLEKEMATHSSILAWRIPGTERSLSGHSPWVCKELDTTEQLTRTVKPSSRVEMKTERNNVGVLPGTM